MLQETKEKIFGKTNTQSLSGTNGEPGSGLGLLLVRDFVALQGGSIAVESEIGKGTGFKFTIPKY